MGEPEFLRDRPASQILDGALNEDPIGLQGSKSETAKKRHYLSDKTLPFLIGPDPVPDFELADLPIDPVKPTSSKQSGAIETPDSNRHIFSQDPSRLKRPDPLLEVFRTLVLMSPGHPRFEMFDGCIDGLLQSGTVSASIGPDQHSVTNENIRNLQQDRRLHERR